jgi:tetrahydromethanopterin S-methyltransferase subunit F
MTNLTRKTAANIGLALWRLEGINIGFLFAIVLHIQLDETLLSSRNKLVH